MINDLDKFLSECESHADKHNATPVGQLWNDIDDLVDIVRELKAHACRKVVPDGTTQFEPFWTCDRLVKAEKRVRELEAMLDKQATGLELMATIELKHYKTNGNYRHWAQSRSRAMAEEIRALLKGGGDYNSADCINEIRGVINTQSSKRRRKL